MKRVGGEDAKESPVGKWQFGKVQTALGSYEERLAKVQWVAGEKFTLADCMAVFSLTTMRGESYPSLWEVRGES